MRLATEVDERWSEWLLNRNRRGMRGVLWIVVFLYPIFGVLDYLIAPGDWLWLLYGTRALVTVVTLALFSFIKTDSFRQHPNGVSASYMVLISLGISLMTVFMGGLASPYYAGLCLVILGSGLLFMWPPQVVLRTYGSIAAAFLVLNLAINETREVLTAISNQFFLISTAIIAGTGQILGYRSQREQVENQLMLERATDNLAKAHRQLKELDRLKSEFFANITHELKTPLTMLLAPLGLLIDGQMGHISEAQRSTFQSMQKSGIKLSRMIGDLLDLSKLEESRLRLRIEEHDLVRYFEDLIAEAQPLAQRKQLELRFECDVEQAMIWCDVDRIERVFVNLLSNATKFTDTTGSVTVRLSDEAESFLIEVHDTGVGFPPNMADEIFGRFVQVDRSDTRRFGGAGIGLALAKELVALHGGSIWAKAQEGEGAHFSVRLLKGRDHFDADALDRRGRSVERVAGKRESDGSLAGWQLDTPSHFRLLDIDEVTEQRVVERDPDEDRREHSVLVVEDTPDVARMIRLALHHEFRFMAAGNGRQGLAMAQRYQPSLVITDWMMPEMDGLELTRRLRADERTKHVPVIMLTARDDVKDRVAGLDTDVNAYLAKPFLASELVSTVRSLLRMRERTAEALLTQRMDSLEVIAGGLAHEIRNPLNYLSNALVTVESDFGKLLGMQAPESAAPADAMRKLEARSTKMFEVARAGVKRIAGTVDLMVRYSREGCSRSLRHHDAYAALRDVVDVVVPTVGRNNVQVTQDLQGDGGVMCVPEELHQVLTNLLQNALEAVDEDLGVVALEGRNEAGKLKLCVRDNGPGIPEDVRSRVFDAFYSTKEVGRGMGMGLTICRRVVTSAGGTLTLKSEVGWGSEFVVSLPSAREGDGVDALA